MLWRLRGVDCLLPLDLCSLKRSRSVRFVSPIYIFFTSFTLDHIC